MMPLCGLGLRSIVIPSSELGGAPFLSICKNFSKTGINSSLTVWLNYLHILFFPCKIV